MKKLAIVIRDIAFGGGGERVATWLANILSHKFKVTIISSFYDEKPLFDLNEKIEINYVLPKVIRMRKAFAYLFRKGWNLFNCSTQDVYLTFGESESLYVYLFRLIKKFTVFHCSHNAIAPLVCGKRISCVRKFGKKFAFYLISRFADKVIVLNENERRCWINKYPSIQNKLEVIYNAADEKLFLSDNEYNLESKTIISVSRIDYFQKGVQHIVPIAKIVFGKHPDWKWVWYGSGRAEDVRNLQKEIDDAGLHNHVVLFGSTGNIYEKYCESSFLVLTSFFEGLPMCLIEAKAKKLPLISFDINSGPSDIIQDGINGYLVKPFDTDGMAKKICYLIENVELRESMSDKSCIGLDKFRADVIAQKWINALS